MYDLEELKERVVLIGVQENDGEEVESSLEELGELARTAGALVAGIVVQRREKIHPGTYIGKGKIEEVRMLVLAQDATAWRDLGVLFQGSEVESELVGQERKSWRWTAG